ncbi:hypothetical protein NY2A_B811R [Paramecium bursaria Chlorella virus NY2A]|uniref:Uncharacterized protein B811R n=1 Tax=Paramecium bursaria Chlorella virus NY2A TaxID=46021 RepID=A7IXY6_PBCVN|nr:hypothetical protein NY2A_B811R [Paramecium bursaria Chlorella virus NY2A]ABT15210.1 hypothetical protein NY2A_B811R [Paramecium bursaria Chlorella virus NY2A]
MFFSFLLFIIFPTTFFALYIFDFSKVFLYNTNVVMRTNKITRITVDGSFIIFDSFMIHKLKIFFK